jgi:hypothetical protein
MRTIFVRTDLGRNDGGSKDLSLKGDDGLKGFSKRWRTGFESLGQEVDVRLAFRARLNTIMAMKIKLSSVFVDDQDKAVCFYTEILRFVK